MTVCDYRYDGYIFMYDNPAFGNMTVRIFQVKNLSFEGLSEIVCVWRVKLKSK